MRRKSRASDIEAMIKQELPEVEGEMEGLRLAAEVEMQHALQDVLEADDAEADDGPDALVECHVEPEASPGKVEAVVEVPSTSLSVALSSLQRKPLGSTLAKRLKGFMAGQKGAAHGYLGAEFGRRGGRPKKEVEPLSLAMGDSLRQSNRRPLSSKAKKDESFGLVARLEGCSVVHKLSLSLRPMGSRCRNCSST